MFHCHIAFNCLDFNKIINFRNCQVLKLRINRREWLKVIQVKKLKEKCPQDIIQDQDQSGRYNKRSDS